MTRRATRAHDFDRSNAEAAALILADSESFGGECAGLVRWARLTLARIEREQAARAAEHGQGELFEEEHHE